MIALTAEELSVPLSMLSSIKDIALRFFFDIPRPKRIGLGRTVTMIALNAEELSVPLSMLSSIRDIALRFLLEYIRIALW